MHHPVTFLLTWLVATLVLQFVGWGGLALLGVVLVFSGDGVRGRWWRLARRARWLLLTLWLILAFGTPGEAYFDFAWSPTDAGLTSAGFHVARLVLMLGLLAWLFERMNQAQLVVGLWAVAQPLKTMGVAVDRLAVRLALVFDYLEHAPPKGAWRHFLHDEGSGPVGPEVIRIELRPWTVRDSAMLLGIGALLLLMACLP